MNNPICTKQPLIKQLHHWDIDEQAARLTGYDQSYQQISKGPFIGVFTSCETDPELALFFEATNQILYQNATVPQNYYAVGLLMDTDRTLTLNCETFPKGAAFILPPGANMEGATSPDLKICVIHVSCHLLNNAFRRQYPGRKLFRPEYIPPILVKSKKDTRRLYSLLTDFQTGAEQGQLSLESPNQWAAFKAALTETVCSLFIATDDRARLGSGLIRNKHRRLFHDALDIIRDNLREELTVGKLCEELGTSRRTLEYVFNEVIEMSPARYIRALRLNNIRREIISMENRHISLGDIAANWGIWHLGRFSRDYRRLFGELPSATKVNRG